jgi:hypothetical protein
MSTVKARFDGRVFVPEEIVDLPVGVVLTIPLPERPSQTNGAHSLSGLAQVLSQFPANPDWPSDGAEQCDHYLYGTPKTPHP